MILANISVPLLGFVDTAVIGHLPSANYLAGTSLGALLVTVLFWLLGFLRMSTTGLVAKAFGQNNVQQQIKYVQQGIVIALIMSVVIFAFKKTLFSALMLVTDTTELAEAIKFAQIYFDIRIWITPIALINLVLAGFLIGRGQTKAVLTAVIICNLVNLVADLILVPILNYGVEGVAYASVLAELTLFGIYLTTTKRALPDVFVFRQQHIRINRKLITLNRDIFVRSLLLQICLSFLTIYATRFGAEKVALNAIIMQLFLFISFAMDGLAFALESLIGQQDGKGNSKKVALYIRTGLIVSTIFAILYTAVYCVAAMEIVAVLTNIESIQILAVEYWPLITLLPLFSYWSFIFDGVFIGLANSKGMLISMAGALVIFFTSFIVLSSFGNFALWIAFCLFMAARGGIQWYLLSRKQLI